MYISYSFDNVLFSCISVNFCFSLVHYTAKFGIKLNTNQSINQSITCSQGRIQDFKLEGEGAHLKLFFVVFRVKNHDFTQKKIIFFPSIGGVRARCAPPLVHKTLLNKLT